MITLKKHNHKDTDSNSNLENEYYCMEDVGFNLKDVNASILLHYLICNKAGDALDWVKS